jgi:hypothetical protein
MRFTDYLLADHFLYGEPGSQIEAIQLNERGDASWGTADDSVFGQTNPTMPTGNLAERTQEWPVGKVARTNPRGRLRFWPNEPE